MQVEHAHEPIADSAREDRKERHEIVRLDPGVSERNDQGVLRSHPLDLCRGRREGRGLRDVLEQPDGDCKVEASVLELREVRDITASVREAGVAMLDPA